MLTRLTAKVLSFLGLFIGFTSEVLAQYGAPVYFYTVKGNVKDIECQQPVKNAQVKLIDRNTGQEITAMTDNDGNFSISNETYYHSSTYKLKIEDPDGKANGQFSTVHADVDTELRRRTYYNNPDTMPADIYYVEYVSGAPCKTENKQIVPETTPDPITEPIPNEEIAPQDSTAVPQNEPTPLPLADEAFTSVVLFPNPNSGSFAIEFTAIQFGKTTISIYTADGSLIFLEDMNIEAGFNHIDLGIETPAPGNYLLSLQNSAGRISKTFIVE